MLIKSADDRSRDLEMLQSLLSHPQATADTRRKIDDEIRKLRSGIKGESDAAYEIDFHYEPSRNWAVIHDLRIEHAGRVAQIDHILLNRLLEVWICESKRFAEGIAVNEHGEFSAFYSGKPIGVPSPLEQNRKHAVVLKALFDSGVVDLPKRLGFTIKPAIRSLVLVSKNARITRPKSKVAGLEDILKVDQFASHMQKILENDNNPLTLAKAISSDTLESLAKQLAALHKPSDFNWHAKFGLDKLPDVAATSSAPLSTLEMVMPVADRPQAGTDRPGLHCMSCAVAVSQKVADFCLKNSTRLAGRVLCMDCQKSQPADTVSAAIPVDLEAGSQLLVCAGCNASITTGVAKYCDANPERFGGRTYCMGCQQLFAVTSASTAATPGESACSTVPEDTAKSSKLACAACGLAVNYNVAKFCWFNKSKFGGNMYCMECQKKI